MSGSSARPMRSVVCAMAVDADSTRAAVKPTRASLFMRLHSRAGAMLRASVLYPGSESPKQSLQACRQFWPGSRHGRRRGNYVLPQMASRGVCIAVDRQLRPLTFANALGMGAARVEMAAGRRCQRTGRISGQDAPRPALRRKHGNGREQGLRVGMARLREDRLGGRALDDAAEVHDGDTRGNVLHDGQIVADEDVGEAETLLQVLEEIEDLAADRDVEGRHRLVADDELGLHS